MSDTIAAIATAPGPGAIGILRLSGPAAAEIAAGLFRPADGRPLETHRPHTLVYGDLLDSGGEVIDRALATFSRAPHSYTGEDTAEIQCHGSPMVLQLGLEALFCPGGPAGRAGGVHPPGLPQRQAGSGAGGGGGRPHRGGDPRRRVPGRRAALRRAEPPGGGRLRRAGRPAGTQRSTVTTRTRISTLSGRTPSEAGWQRPGKAWRNCWPPTTGGATSPGASPALWWAGPTRANPPCSTP